LWPGIDVDIQGSEEYWECHLPAALEAILNTVDNEAMEIALGDFDGVFRG
jgi:hypothetical protein